jgi:NADH dehydrogenase [ubiquinone] 1 alpha subcomplex assembly factor 7
VSPETNQLAIRLAQQIQASGPISVAEYMRAANAEYYNRADPLGVAGDFITAPEISQIFGELVGIWITDIWLRQNSPECCRYVELGPGRGTLAADALRAMAKFDFAPDVHFVETSEMLRARQTAAVPHARFHRSIDDLPGDGPLFIVANEFFDALPVRQLVSTHAGWRERVVARDRGTRFMAMPGAQPVDTAVPDQFRQIRSDAVYETSPEASGIMFELALRLEKQGGVMLIIDYGYDEPTLGSTLQAVKNHEFADPFENPGEHDLSAHVNFRELGNIGRMRELRVNGPVGQGVWLEALGIDQRAAILADAAPEHAADIFHGLDRLVKADQMGELFKVMAIGSAEWPLPEGFEPSA